MAHGIVHAGRVARPDGLQAVGAMVELVGLGQRLGAGGGRPKVWRYFRAQFLWSHGRDPIAGTRIAQPAELLMIGHGLAEVNDDVMDVLPQWRSLRP